MKLMRIPYLCKRIISKYNHDGDKMDIANPLKNLSFDDILNIIYMKKKDGTITELDNEIIRIGYFDGQVKNGGIYQWISNGYTSNHELDKLIKFLNKVSSYHCKIIINMIKILSHNINQNSTNTGFFGDQNYWIDDNFDDDDDDYMAMLNNFDDEYYKIDDEFLEEITNYYISQVNEENQ